MYRLLKKKSYKNIRILCFIDYGFYRNHHFVGYVWKKRYLGLYNWVLYHAIDFISSVETQNDGNTSIRQNRPIKGTYRIVQHVLIVSVDCLQREHKYSHSIAIHILSDIAFLVAKFSLERIFTVHLSSFIRNW